MYRNLIGDSLDIPMWSGTHGYRLALRHDLQSSALSHALPKIHITHCLFERGFTPVLMEAAFAVLHGRCDHRVRLPRRLQSSRDDSTTPRIVQTNG